MQREVTPAPLWVAATRHDESIVGQYGGIPVRVKLGGVERPALNTVEAMTAPRFRRQGVISALGTAAHQGWGQAGYASALALPNEQWGTRTYALGFRRVFPLAWLRFPLHAERAVSRPGRVPAGLRRPAALLAGAGSALWRGAFRGIMRTLIGRCNVCVGEAEGPGDFDRLWEQVGGDYENVVVRDGEWVLWRFMRAAVHEYKILVARRGGEPSGYIAYYMSEAGTHMNGCIADIFMGRNDAATTSALVKSALEDLSARGAGMVLATAPPGSALYQRLRGLGFLRTPRRMAFNFQIAPLQPDVDPATLSDPRTWHLTAGDFDVV
jgi:hypothetical protein